MWSSTDIKSLHISSQWLIVSDKSKKVQFKNIYRLRLIQRSFLDDFC